MWWCCGRKNKEAAGCKFGKHLNKDDEEHDEINFYAKRLT
jgi:hypothetical protein